MHYMIAGDTDTDTVTDTDTDTDTGSTIHGQPQTEIETQQCFI